MYHGYRLLASLTFDDGYLSHYNIAKLLYKEGVRATFFVITHLRSFEGKPLLTIAPELIQEMHEMGHEIGSHGCTHRILTSLSEFELEQELLQSKQYLGRLIGSDIRGFAYPGGFWNKKVVLYVAKYYDYARMAGKRFESRSWNANKKSCYFIEGIGAKELVKLPTKYFIYRRVMPVIVFHDDPWFVVKLVIRLLRAWGAELLPLNELVNHMGCHRWNR